MKIKLLAILLLATGFLLLNLSGCGQKGDLYLPEKQQIQAAS